MRRPFCPHCGYNFEADEPVEIDGWILTSADVTFAGTKLRLARQECAFLHTLASADGEWVKSDALLNRISDSDSTNLVAVVAAHVRRKLGSLAPIEGSRQRGYRWAAPCTPTDAPVRAPAGSLPRPAGGFVSSNHGDHNG